MVHTFFFKLSLHEREIIKNHKFSLVVRRLPFYRYNTTNVSFYLMVRAFFNIARFTQWYERFLKFSEMIQFTQGCYKFRS